jgi:hypothetical protein
MGGSAVSAATNTAAAKAMEDAKIFIVSAYYAAM